MKNKDLLLHALSRYRSALPADVKTSWSTRHGYDIALALFNCAKTLAPKEAPEFIVHVDKISGKALSQCIFLDGAFIDFFGSGANERAEDSIFDTQTQLLTIKCKSPIELQIELMNRDFFSLYWDAPAGFQNSLSMDILGAAKDFTI